MRRSRGRRMIMMISGSSSTGIDTKRSTNILAHLELNRRRWRFRRRRWRTIIELRSTTRHTTSRSGRRVIIIIVGVCTNRRDGTTSRSRIATSRISPSRWGRVAHSRRIVIRHDRNCANWRLLLLSCRCRHWDRSVWVWYTLIGWGSLLDWRIA